MLRAVLLALWAHGVRAELAILGLHHPGGIDLAGSVGDCTSALAVVDYCFVQTDFTVQPTASQKSCLCCVGTSNISPVYSSCASYLTSALPAETDLYTVNSGFASYCSVAGTAPCRGGSGSTTPTTTGTGFITTGTSTAKASVTYPPACDSMDSMVFSCERATPSFTSLAASEQAKCICYNTRDNSFTTKYDSFATTCISWIKTEVPTLYTSVSAWTTFCARRSPDVTDPFTVPTVTPSVSSTRRTTTTTAVPTLNPNTVRSSTRSAPAAQVMPSGPLVWMAQALTYVLSFFFLV